MISSQEIFTQKYKKLFLKLPKKAKEDILIIWTDYFKPEHVEKYPDLHEKVWNACKLGSYVKQNVDLAKAKEFKASLEEIGEIFWETKK